MDPETINNIKDAKRKHLPIDEIVKLYTEDMLSLRKLSKLFNSSKQTIHKILEENNILVRTSEEVITTNRKYKRFIFNGDEKEKAYLTGLVVGDISTYKKSKYTLRLITNTTVNQFVELFQNTFSKYGHITIRQNKKRIKEFGLSIDLDLKSFEFLIKAKKDISFVNDLNKKEFLHFLAGFIDADGSIMIKRSDKFLQFVIRLYNTNKDLLQIIQHKLEDFGFKVHIHMFGRNGDIRYYDGKLITYRSDYFAVEVSNRKDVFSLISQLPLRHESKVEKINEMWFQV